MLLKGIYVGFHLVSHEISVHVVDTVNRDLIQVEGQQAHF